DALGGIDTQALSLTIYSAVAVTTTTVPAGEIGKAYSKTLAASGGKTAYGWALAPASGALPTGVTLSAAGVISGTPTQAGTFNITVRVTDAIPAFDDQALSLTIFAAVLVTTATVPAGEVNRAYT